jgi:kynureninase
MSASSRTAGRQAAQALDRADVLAQFRRQFLLPQAHGRPATYLCGHSLGPQPRRARALVDEHLRVWAEEAVDGHFSTRGGWYDFHTRLTASLARLTGARRTEVVAMNSLTVNLHLMLLGFFTPSAQRNRILIEADAFPSDRYAVRSQLVLHDLDPTDHLVELHAQDRREGITPDLLDGTLAAARGTVAVVLLPGVQYLTGQLLDIAGCARVAHAHGALIGLDLAHAIGNVPLQLHRHEVDFAVWCSYKYLNGGPGAIGGCFVHARHDRDARRPRLAGWWGHDARRRFLMERDFMPIVGAEGWQLSNPPIFAMLPLLASLEIFDAAGIGRLRSKSRQLTAYCERLVDTMLGDAVTLLTPKRSNARGAQLSLQLRAHSAQQVAASLHERGIVVDAREPDVLRLAPAPLYNRFVEVWRTVDALARVLA